VPDQVGCDITYWGFVDIPCLDSKLSHTASWILYSRLDEDNVRIFACIVCVDVLYDRGGAGGI
jgi:hypothetical protein